MKSILIAVTVLIQSTLASYFVSDDVLNLPRYKVSLLTTEKIPQSQLHDATFNDQTMLMRDSYGQPFLCNIPQVDRDEAEHQEQMEAETKDTHEDEQKLIERGLELLQPLENSCLQFYTHQYWAYEYCHKQYVRQFHVESVYDGRVERKKETASHYLGKYPGVTIDQNPIIENALLPTIRRDKTAKRPVTTLKQVGNQRYLLQQWGDGSTCDFTKKPRTVEVQYQCEYQGHDRISYMEEISTCHYLIVISTPRLCEEMKLSRIPKPRIHTISCTPIVSDKLIEAEREQEEQKQEQQPLIEEQKEEEKPMNDETKERVISKDPILKLLNDLNEQIDLLKSQVNGYSSSDDDINIMFIDEDGNYISSNSELKKLLKLEKTFKKKEEKEQKEQPRLKLIDVFQQQ
ncbi:hypothetical protein BCV71DRAFT_260100 [Rhizopus microsporus]|nr:hypothetical protein BCV71DRAFT_260100 [Rhizopus microsporus]